MKFELSRQIFSKNNSYIKFNENLSSGSRAVLFVQPDGRIDRHDEVNSGFYKFCESA